MVASFDSRARSVLRSSETSRSSTTAPCPSASGIERSDRVPPVVSTSSTPAVAPVATLTSAWSAEAAPPRMRATTRAICTPTNGVVSPIARIADWAFGLANCTVPLRSIRSRPSPTR